jgi:hypothetical protein
MVKKEPSPAQQRLWLARVKAEQAAGTPVEETAQVLNQMVGSWLAVQLSGENSKNET